MTMQSFPLLLHDEAARSDQTHETRKIFPRRSGRGLSAQQIPNNGASFRHTLFPFHCGCMEMAKKKMTCVTLIRALNRKCLHLADGKYQTTKCSL